MPSSSYPGSLLVFEGIDGTGKSTQISLLARALTEQGHNVLLSYEPTDGPLGKKLRASMIEGRLSPDEELALFHDDRRDHVKRLILPALREGKIVILDRYYFSTMAYQGTRGYDPVKIREHNETFAPIPDQVFLLELPVATALKRIGVRDGQGNSFEKKENLEACTRVFDTLCDPFISRIDASQDVETIHAAILKQTMVTTS